MRIEQAAVSVTRVRIHPCAGASAPRPLLAPAVAYAHDPVPATFAEPRVVVDLMVGDAEPIAIATLRPPPGRYCGATVELGPGWGGGLSGETFAVRGTYVPPGGGAPEPFEIRSSAPLETGITFDAADGTPRVFRAEPGAPAPRVLVGLHYGRWLDGVDFRDPDAAARVEAVERSVLASIHGVM
ncbi:MAG: hypothetical protein D6689_22990 [Deltaproteobacteria bacterium]|nr:MAG: hypothetical protein D6689_22990 [Deltaproteobacteria bacterium]